MVKKGLVPGDSDPASNKGNAIQSPMESYKERPKTARGRNKKSLLNGPYGAVIGKADADMNHSSTKLKYSDTDYLPRPSHFVSAFGKKADRVKEKESTYFKTGNTEPRHNQTKSSKNMLDTGISIFDSQKQAEARAKIYNQNDTLPRHEMRTVAPVTQKSKKINDNVISVESEDEIQVMPSVPREKKYTLVQERTVSQDLPGAPSRALEKVIPITAAWKFDVAAHFELLHVTNLELTTNVIRLSLKNARYIVFLCNDILQVNIKSIYEEGHQKTFLGISAINDEKYALVISDFQRDWLFRFCSMSENTVGDMDDELSTQIAISLLDWQQRKELNPPTRRNSSRIEGMQGKDNDELKKYTARRASKGKQEVLTDHFARVEPRDNESTGEFYTERRKSQRTDSTRFEEKLKFEDPEKKKGKRQVDVIEGPPYIPPPKTNEEIFKFPADGSKYAIAVREHDKHRLNPGEFLNDTVIEFCFRYWQENHPQEASKVKFFNSYFYNHLTSDPNTGKFGGGSSKIGWNYPKVEKWSKDVDIFKKDFIIVPINENLHWYLAVIINPAAAIVAKEDMEVINVTSSSISDGDRCDGDEEEEDIDGGSAPSNFSTPDEARYVIQETRSNNQKRHRSKSQEEANVTFELAVSVTEEAVDDDHMEVDDPRDYNSDNSPEPRATSSSMNSSSTKLDSNSPVHESKTHANISGTDDIACYGKQIGGGTEDGSVSISSTDEERGRNFSNPTKDDPICLSDDSEDDQVAKVSKRPKPTTTKDKHNKAPPPSADEQLNERRERRKREEEQQKSEKEEQKKLKRREAEKKKQEKEEAAYLDRKNKCCIVVLDSLNIHRPRVYDSLKHYLTKEAYCKKSIQVNPDQIVMLKNPYVPIQPNHYDCGVYTIRYVEKLLENADFYKDYLLRRRNDRHKWFDHSDIDTKRVQITSLMDSFQQEYEKMHPKAVEASSSKSKATSSRKRHNVDEDSDVVIIEDD